MQIRLKDQIALLTNFYEFIINKFIYMNNYRRADQENNYISDILNIFIKKII